MKYMPIIIIYLYITRYNIIIYYKYTILSLNKIIMARFLYNFKRACCFLVIFLRNVYILSLYYDYNDIIIIIS